MCIFYEGNPDSGIKQALLVALPSKSLFKENKERFCDTIFFSFFKKNSDSIPFSLQFDLFSDHSTLVFVREKDSYKRLSETLSLLSLSFNHLYAEWPRQAIISSIFN